MLTTWWNRRPPGWAVASGPALLVGAPAANRATFFLRNAVGGWSEVQSLNAADPNNTSFGNSVGFDGGYAAIGARRR